MQIEFLEIQNFRKLKSIRIDFHQKKTIFVGANNSGKTSAMQSLDHFLIDPRRFSTNDFTLSNWSHIDKIGQAWAAHDPSNGPLEVTLADWESVLPSLDLWLNVESNEIHHVSHLLPTLDWEGGRLGVRLRFEPKNIDDLSKDYLAAVRDAQKTKEAACAKAGKDLSVSLWPRSMREFLERRLSGHFAVKAYSLDPAKLKVPTQGQAHPQSLPPESEPIERDPFKGLIQINKIDAQRGLGESSLSPRDGEDGRSSSRRSQRKLTEQLRAYYAKHLDPSEFPEPEDLAALGAIEDAQKVFDIRLRDGFDSALKELEGLNYPGITDPRLTISTKLKPTDGLDHDAAVQYDVISQIGEVVASSLKLPEEYNGLGYQNLISMVFRLMGFRDAWMEVKKAAKKSSAETAENGLPPLHLVLVEEPEAHLHAQVQQVFIRKAYSVLRNHPDLLESMTFSTQLVVSTHSSHVAHESDFSSLRYFRRLPAFSAGEVPISTVVNLSEVFGKDDDTQKFATRYLTSTHSDLFFADAAIFIEGSAERMLLPHFIKNHFTDLHQRYITLLEIGGSHAYRLRQLVDHLGLTTLVITDIDAAEPTGKHAASPAIRGRSLITRNSTLKTWHPEISDFDSLLDLEESKKEKKGDDIYSVRVAYQCPVQISLDDSSAVGEVLANTFEDALVMENIEFFKALDGDGLIRKVRDILNDSPSLSTLSVSMFDALKSANKAAFALDLLYSDDPSKLKVPTYIARGLEWMQEQLKRRDAELLSSEDQTHAQQKAA